MSWLAEKKVTSRAAIATLKGAWAGWVKASATMDRIKPIWATAYVDASYDRWPDPFTIMHIPFQTNGFASATSMTRDEFVEHLRGEAESLRLNVLSYEAEHGAVPASLTFANESRKGRTVFGVILLFIYLSGLAVFFIEQVRHPAEFGHASQTLIGFAILSAVLCTWIGNVPALRRDDSG